MEQYLPTIISILTLIVILWGFRDRIFKKGIKEQALSDRISNLEKSDKEIKSCIAEQGRDVKNMKENHLAHMQIDINKINISIAQIRHFISK